MQLLLVLVTAKFPLETTASFYSKDAQFLNCRPEIPAIKLPYDVNLFCSEEGLFRPVCRNLLSWFRHISISSTFAQVQPGEEAVILHQTKVNPKMF